MMKNIILVGFPGAGKTTIGNKLAKRLNRPFVDLDAAIEIHYKASIPHLFQQYGEFAFRKCERAVLKNILKQDSLVLATGGGAPCFEDNMDIMTASGLTVYIKLPKDMLVERLRHSHRIRPNTSYLSDSALQKYVEDTLPEREKYYNQAQIIVSGENLNLEELIRILSRPVP